jgi:NDP-sugar pyrophosphorylase family protein
VSGRNQTFHGVSLHRDLVTDVECISRADIWLNGGFFIFHKDIFRYLKDGEELVEQPFRRLIKVGQLLAYQYRASGLVWNLAWISTGTTTDRLAWKLMLERVMHFRLNDGRLAVWNGKPTPAMSAMRNGLLWPPI